MAIPKLSYRITSFEDSPARLNDWIAQVNSQLDALQKALTRTTAVGGAGGTITNNLAVSNTIISGTGTSPLFWSVPGGLQVDDIPSVPTVLTDALTITTWTAVVVTAPTGSSLVITVGKTPPGGARTVVATLTIAAGTTSTTAAGTTFAARDKVDIQITAVGSTLTGEDLAIKGT